MKKLFIMITWSDIIIESLIIYWRVNKKRHKRHKIKVGEFEMTVSESIEKCHRGLLRSFWHWVWESNNSFKFSDDEIDSCFYGNGGGKINNTYRCIYGSDGKKTND